MVYVNQRALVQQLDILLQNACQKKSPRSEDCRVGSGFENHAKFGEAIYYHNNQGIYVNLFIPSQVTLSLIHI